MAVLLVGLVRCGGDTPTVVIQPEAPVPTTIEVSPSPLLLFSLGGSVQATKAARVETSAAALTLGGPGAEEMLAVTAVAAGS